MPSLQQVRLQNIRDARGLINTYDRDFEYLEVNEQDLHMLSDNEVNSANDSLEADAACAVAVEDEKNKKNSKQIVTPPSSSSKAPSSR